MSDLVSSVLNVNRLDVAPTPFPHVVVDGFFKPDVFGQLRDGFPNIVKMNRPKGWGQSLYWGEAEYERHLQENPVWKQVFDVVHSQSFIEYMIDQFGELWEREGCAIDLSKACYVPYCEDRIDKERGQLRKVEHKPHELWCRLDFYESWEGYYRPVHLDHRRRLISMLVYFTNPEEIGMQGGELILHSPGVDLSLLQKLGFYHGPKAFSIARDRLATNLSVKPRDNRMAVFMCGKKSWHSVPPVQSPRAPRRHIHIVISSSVDAWH